MKLPNLSPDHIMMTDISDNVTLLERAKEIIRLCETYYRDWVQRRQERTLMMQEAWASYFNTSEATEWLRRRVMSREDKNYDWRHKIRSGKAFDIVETIVPYLMRATFPNEDWFDMVPRMPIPLDDKETQEFLQIMKAFVKMKLDEADFKERYEAFLRQACIIGTSGVFIPWKLELKPRIQNVKVKSRDSSHKVTQKVVNKIVYNAPIFEVLDMVDTFLDPDEPDPNRAGVIRRTEMTRAAVTELSREKFYDLISEEDVKSLKTKHRSGKSLEQEEKDYFVGIQTAPTHPSDVIEVFEFWGTLHLKDCDMYDVVVTWSGNNLLRVETNPYWCGRPFVFINYISVLNTPYGIGALDPVLSLLHEKDSIKNQRLDGLEVALNPAMGYKDDGVFDPNQFDGRPGSLHQMAGNDSVWNIISDTNFRPPSVDEENMIEGEVDRRTGTGSFIGSGQGRTGERVTAREVNAVQEAGGNRLSGVHSHIETQGLLRILKIMYELCQQYITDDEVVPFRKRSDELTYAQVGIDQLAYEMQLKPMGAEHVADKEYALRQRIDWVSLVGGNPMMAEMVDWEQVLKEITRHFLGIGAERFIKGAPAPMQTPEQAAMGQLTENAAAVDGQELSNAVKSQIMADGGNNLSNAVAATNVPQPAFGA